MDIYKYNSIDALCKAVDDLAKRPEAAGYSGFLEGAATAKFRGTSSMEEAQKLIQSGCLDIVKKLSAEVKNIKRPGTVTKIRPYNSVVGFLPNVPNYLAGVPEQMINYRRNKVDGQSKIVNIFYNLNFSGAICANDITRVGAYVYALAQAYERKGYRTNIYTGSVSLHGPTGKKFSTRVQLKKTSERFNMAVLSYCFCHPSFLRRHLFALEEAHGYPPYDTYCRTATAEELNLPNCIIINGLAYIKNPEAILSL